MIVFFCLQIMNKSSINKYIELLINDLSYFYYYKYLHYKTNRMYLKETIVRCQE